MSHRHLTLIGLPGSGGIAVARLVRSRVNDGDTVKILSIAAPEAIRGYSLDPFGFGLAVPDPTLPERRLAAAERTAGRLAWLLWEMGVAVTTVVSHATVAQAVSFALDCDCADLVVVATASRRDLPGLRRQIAALGRETNDVVLVHDRCPGIGQRLLTHMADRAESRLGTAAPR